VTEMSDVQRWSEALRSTTDALTRVASNARTLFAESVLFTATSISDPTLPLPCERALLDRLVGYLSLPIFADDVDVFLEEGHRNSRKGEFGSASAFFRGAAIHQPARVAAHTGLVLAQDGTRWDEDWIWGRPDVGDMEIAISALRQAADNADGLEMWRTDAERWHRGETDPLLLAAEVLSRLHVIEPVAHIPKGFTDRWALVQLRTLFTAVNCKWCFTGARY
jgi:hypothetical protein